MRMRVSSVIWPGQSKQSSRRIFLSGRTAGPFIPHMWTMSWCYSMSKNLCPILCDKFLYEMGQDFLDISTISMFKYHCRNEHIASEDVSLRFHIICFKIKNQIFRIFIFFEYPAEKISDLIFVYTNFKKCKFKEMQESIEWREIIQNWMSVIRKGRISGNVGFPALYRNLLQIMGQEFVDRQYVVARQIRQIPVRVSEFLVHKYTSLVFNPNINQNTQKYTWQIPKVSI